MGSLPLDALQPLDPDTFAADSSAVVDFLAGYYRDVDKYPVRAADLEPGRLRRLLPEAAPEFGEPAERILADVRRDVLPGLTHWQSPSFFAYFPMNASAAGFAGEMLSVGLNVVPFMWVASPAAVELEATHATFQKGARLVGISPANFRVVPTAAASGYALTGAAVRAAVEGDVARGLVPLYLCATVGTTGIGAVDPVRELGEVARRHGMWLHVDAAYAGSAAICPEYQGYLDGAELADSVSMNPHKWFLTNMDCCCLWVASPAALTAALSTDPEYLKNAGGGKPQAAAGAGAIDYKDWQISLSRRFRAMKLWFVLRRYGAAGMRAHIRRHVAMAEWFERAVSADERFEVVAKRRFSLVCFRLRGGGDAMNRELLAAVNASGRVFMTHFVVEGKFVIRLAVGGAMTEMRHVGDAWELVQRTAEQLLQRR
uniref:Tyrosine decarboxylase n=1 Tax=Oryza barthii TaxID=65489 RepID=A0A0D3HDD8_9ORYZ